jgi:hypothetical protein
LTKCQYSVELMIRKIQGFLSRINNFKNNWEVISMNFLSRVSLLSIFALLFSYNVICPIIVHTTILKKDDKVVYLFSNFNDHQLGIKGLTRRALKQQADLEKIIARLDDNLLILTEAPYDPYFLSKIKNRETVTQATTGLLLDKLKDRHEYQDIHESVLSGYRKNLVDYPGLPKNISECSIMYSVCSLMQTYKKAHVMPLDDIRYDIGWLFSSGLYNLSFLNKALFIDLNYEEKDFVLNHSPSIDRLERWLLQYTFRLKSLTYDLDEKYACYKDFIYLSELFEKELQNFKEQINKFLSVYKKYLGGDLDDDQLKRIPLNNLIYSLYFVSEEANKALCDLRNYLHNLQCNLLSSAVEINAFNCILHAYRYKKIAVFAGYRHIESLLDHLKGFGYEVIYSSMFGFGDEIFSSRFADVSEGLKKHDFTLKEFNYSFSDSFKFLLDDQLKTIVEDKCSGRIRRHSPYDDKLSSPKSKRSRTSK